MTVRLSRAIGPEIAPRVIMKLTNWIFALAAAGPMQATIIVSGFPSRCTTDPNVPCAYQLNTRTGDLAEAGYAMAASATTGRGAW